MQTNPSLHPANATAQPAPTKAPSRRVTDAPTRMFHWLFAVCFAGAYATADGEHWRLLHVTLGYTMAGLLGFRLLYGIFGPRTSGLGLLWRKLAGAPAWLRALPPSKTITQINWRQGQSLLMALAIVLLLTLVVPLTLSGYATYNDWGAALGGDWMEEVHEFFGNALLFVVLAHIALIAGLSVLRRKNQALPMLTGRVEGKGPDLIPKNRTWLAALLLIASLAFGTWQWQQSPSSWVANGTSTERQRHHDDD
ncbi:cytochrome b/b6 domain-containing protein [Acidovorax sp. D2M1]|uniref:Cytochrome b/b6 domain-containing protein n=1 Tax=Acidovorax benzenivorans TaxID=2987520 RepID=A0ABT5RVE2_9BURK|nr:cytochrome b/b6 domain-containing protein [Acidovorax benzenivorans]MDD2177671.1 cytochrome b/b6 domain-containing protein [Acidovorax benzenivorans]